ncbi:MAG: putative Ig domain-containing protein, partial [Planctomycetaceae bacterium]
YAAGDRAGRDSLFPQTRLANETTDGTLDLTGPEEFPAKPDFLVRIGDQYLNVTSVDKDPDGGSGTRWVTKSDGSEQRLAADSIVELVRVADSMQAITLDDYKLVNPFARYEARLVVSGTKMITVGEAFSLTARVEGSRPGVGTTFELGAHPDGMTIDGRTGKIAWQTSKDQSSGRASVEVFAKLDGSESRLSGSPTAIEWKAVAVVVARNRPPTLNRLRPITVVAGTAVEFTVAGRDPERGALAFALGAGAPGGATIDAASGRFRWVPQDAGNFQVTVEVRDDGSPSQKATGRVAISVSPDSSQFTVLIGSIVRDGVSQAWFFDRLKNQRIVLRNKSRFRYGDVDAEVVLIEDRAVVFRIGKEERRLLLGDSLQELRPRAKKPDEASRQPAKATKAKSAGR